MNEFRPTYHGALRLRKRLKVHRTSFVERVQEAYEKGVPLGDLHGRLRRFVDKRCKIAHNKAEVKIYAGQIWVFIPNDSHSLITCFPIAGKLAKDAVEQIKKYQGK